VAGAALALQGICKAAKNEPLTPAQMRSALSTLGTPQGTGTPEHIGMMPDLRKAATGLSLVPAGPAPGNPPVT
jgi:hypothetical protein